MEEVTSGLYRLARKHHNFYLIVDGGRATVVDAGGRRELPLLKAGLEHLGLTLDSVEALLITHAHSDHVGFARKVADRGASVRVHEAEAASAMDGDAGYQVSTDGLVHSGLFPQLLQEPFHLDAALARDSLDHLEGLDVDLLLPGHGPPWRGPIVDAVARARG